MLLRDEKLATSDKQWETEIALNGFSFVNLTAPIWLVEFELKGVYKLDFQDKQIMGAPKMRTSIINGTSEFTYAQKSS